MPPDGTLINGSVSGKMDRHLHPEDRVVDWQAGRAMAPSARSLRQAKWPAQATKYALHSPRKYRT